MVRLSVESEKGGVRSAVLRYFDRISDLFIEGNEVKGDEQKTKKPVNIELYGLLNQVFDDIVARSRLELPTFGL